MVAFDVMRKNRELGILAVDHIAVAGDHAQFAVLDVAEGADAVPLHFEKPTGSVGGGSPLPIWASIGVRSFGIGAFVPGIFRVFAVR